MEGEDGVSVKGRAEIDTRAPFQSVKEAVMLFGERVLAGEVYANKIREMRAEIGNSGPRLGTVTAELEETKQSLQKAKEEGMLMENCLTNLKEELEQTKRELEQIKARELEKMKIDSEMEDLKFIEHPIEMEDSAWGTPDESELDFQKKRYVKFASPPSLAKVMTPDEGAQQVLERHPSLKKKKKKPLIPLIAGLFFKKRGQRQDQGTPNGHAL
ncbi:hypothetical protein Scep_000391 [Stephania cephalantha]|uniref:WEB family protein n=1 Tax=Stephania cephalantha TaxID=152367 RepID=A0AAP0L705_9MAGN